MHELSIAEAVVEQVEALRRREGATAVVSVTMAVGEWSGVDAEALRTAFALAAEPVLGSAARLEIESVPVEVRCRSCGASAPPPERSLLMCPACYAADVELVHGRELILRAVALEYPQEPNGGG